MRLFGNFGVGTWCFTSQMLILTAPWLGSGYSLGFLKMCYAEKRKEKMVVPSQVVKLPKDKSVHVN